MGMQEDCLFTAVRQTVIYVSHFVNYNYLIYLPRNTTFDGQSNRPKHDIEVEIVYYIYIRAFPVCQKLELLIMTFSRHFNCGYNKTTVSCTEIRQQYLALK